MLDLSKKTLGQKISLDIQETPLSILELMCYFFSKNVFLA